jgi:Icc-related predicted phosphoesterase
MTLLIIADDEGLLHKLPFAPADVLVSCGDLPDDIVLKAAGRCGCRHILAVKGNHDGSAAFPDRIVDLHLRSQEIEGIRFGGFGGSWKYKPRGHHLYDQLEVHEALADFPAVDVFVAHNSPRLIHDREDGIHLGFEAFTNYVERARPRLLLHGHQHVNAESTLLFTRVVGTYGPRYVEVFPRAR